MQQQGAAHAWREAEYTSLVPSHIRRLPEVRKLFESVSVLYISEFPESVSCALAMITMIRRGRFIPT